MNMDWNFQKRSGTLSITDFDEGRLNVEGTMNMPGNLSSINKFSGDLRGIGSNFTGAANGSFARHSNDAAAGVIGNWRAGDSDYKATGLFGGGRSNLNLTNVPGH